jgi:type IV pilus assembly protein PilV
VQNKSTEAIEAVQGQGPGSKNVRKNSLVNRHRSAGLTLVEILITLLVVSVGLLGVAGLHAMSLRNNYDALMRSHASALAADIVDRMRANRAAVLVPASEYVIDMKTDVDVGDDPTIATMDLKEWRDALAAQLPGGRGSVQINTRMVTITIQWGERGEKNNDPVSFVTRTEI